MSSPTAADRLGERPWPDAIADGSVGLFGEPDLIRASSTWLAEAIGA
jgi:hypothetical protein